MQRQIRAISEFTYLGTKYEPGDAFRHELPDVELGGLVRTRLVEVVPSSEPPPAAARVAATAPKQRKRRAQAAPPATE